ncbi:MAG TPA: hypothetical protein VFG78_10640 [Gemmatimonadota bacterium]|nr:hypothetical protein [Gemmatimonadota bacterium]
MEPKRFREMETGETLMLASEIMERTSVSQVYEKIDARTVRQVKTGETREVADEELVYPFQADHAAPQV